jgi:Mn2+/Fe2+ NRAMP family transporter
LDAGVKGAASLPEVTRSSVSGIAIASVMRIFLFLAALGVVAQGLVLDPANPPASVFQLAAGSIGYKIFGIVMWAAAVTSVVGCAYTSVSFIRTFHPKIEQAHKWIIIGFIAISTLVFLIVGRPVKILVLVGALNGLILPITLGVMLIAAYRKKIVGDYQHPLWMAVFGGIVVAAMACMSIYTLINELPKLML